MRDWGSGKPLIFLAGWTLASDAWGYEMVRLFERGFRCVAYDRRGHGRSDDPGRGYDYDTLADDLAHVLDVLDLRNVTLVGHSMAGGEMARYLARHGYDRVARLLFVAPITPMILDTPDNPTGITSAMLEAGRKPLLTDFPKWIADNAPPFFLPTTSPQMIEWGMAMMLRASLQAVVESARIMTGTDFRADLQAIRMPTVVIHGDRDASAPLALTGRRTAELVPGAKLIVYEGAPHGIFATYIDQLTADISAFAGAP